MKVYLQKYDLELEATDENLATVHSFVEEHLEAVGCSPRAQMQITAAAVSIIFLDRDMPSPPAQEDPALTLSDEEREIGGLGIFMTKEFRDDVPCEYMDGKNILTLKKNLK